MTCELELHFSNSAPWAHQEVTGAPLGRVRVTWSGEGGAKLSQCPPLHDSGVCKWLTGSLHTQFGSDETFITFKKLPGVDFCEEL